MRLTTALLALSLVAGCDEDPPPASPPPTPAPATPDEPDPAPVADQAAPTEVGTMMREHFLKAREAREALVRGDVEAARAAMSFLATHDLGTSLPDALRPKLAEMQAAAGTFGAATTLREAGAALATTLSKCGECHRAADQTPSFAVPPVPEGDTVQVHMLRHQWASDRMWEGLVMHDEAHYRSGAQILGDVTLHASDLDDSAEAPEQIEAMAQHVHTLGEQAMAATDDAGRADVYGRFIATCATCHRLLEGGPTEDR